MINRIVIAPEQALYAIQHGEFENSIITSKSKVVVAMTQDWCPQWHNMQRWIYTLPLNEDVDIYELIYNRTSIYHHFMNFKEDVWESDQVPYLRFYKEGMLVKETHYIPAQEFQRAVQG